MIRILIAGIFSAGFSYILNKLMLTKLGDRALIVLIPFIEEMAKSTAAIVLKTNFIGVHFVFGCIEGIYDYIYSNKKIGKWAALASVISHTFFGSVTFLIYTTTQRALLGILVAWIFHSTWNWYITNKI
ncbi:hypothetical protein RH915_06765 [Serpentinicella sp. ANB-PHB4]|uniref:hypothetical protein n=1 Tax=Serpentinicella sp. ANB-PHB4 TaxID=3074076 RepID=UPI00285A0B36|nr:hypothetical protein [Serpentinicella sp. ANB-PHB4]MDR5659187.1 hypothetical protein [Serpentinicella sp. ANB-PHB4]